MNKKRFCLWGLASAWALVIFYFSAQTGGTSSGLSGKIIRMIYTIIMPRFELLDMAQQLVYIESLQLIVRKTAHFSVYAVLGILVVSAIFTHKLAPRKSTSSALTICFLYACSDELHQVFVPGRAGVFTDVLIDTAGAFVGIMFMHLIMVIIKKMRPSA